MQLNFPPQPKPDEQKPFTESKEFQDEWNFHAKQGIDSVRCAVLCLVKFCVNVSPSVDPMIAPEASVDVDKAYDIIWFAFSLILNSGKLPFIVTRVNPPDSIMPLFSFSDQAGQVHIMREFEPLRGLNHSTQNKGN